VSSRATPITVHCPCGPLSPNETHYRLPIEEEVAALDAMAGANRCSESYAPWRSVGEHPLFEPRRLARGVDISQRRPRSRHRPGLRRIPRITPSWGLTSTNTSSSRRP